MASIDGNRQRISENVYPLSKFAFRGVVRIPIGSSRNLRSRADLKELQRLEERDQRAAVCI